MSSQNVDATSPPSVSLRAGIIGLLLSALVSFWGQYAADHLGYNYMTYTQLPSALLMPFLLLIMVPHLLLKAFAPALAFNRSELIVIFSMGLIGSMVPDWGMTRYLIAVITAPYYFASPENRWAEIFFDTLPNWLVLSNQGDVARMYFEGVGAGQSIPWGAWITPLFWWLSFLAALMFVGACLVVMLRKQWVENERLRFPLGEVAMNLMQTEPGADEPNRPPMIKTPLFKVGFILALAMTGWNILSYWEVVARIPIMGEDTLPLLFDPQFPSLVIRLNIFALCFAFFINTEILFSVWFFLLFTTIQRGVMSLLGITASTAMVPTGLVGTQSIGALIAFVLWGLWMARHHLKDVVQKAFGKGSVDDSGEMFSYRTAVIGFLGALIYLVIWLMQAGMSLPIVLLFLLALLIFYLGMARIVAEAGLVMLDLPVNANVFTAGMVGPANLSPATITALGMTNAFARNWRTFTMIGLSHVTWFQRRMPASRHLFRWIVLAFGASVVVSLFYVIYSGYTVGADNLRTDPSGLGQFFYNMIPSWAGSSTRVSALEITFLLSGVGLYILMMVGRYLFIWWPFHPIGLIAIASDPIRSVFLPFFLAWLIQVILLRIGGGTLYRKAQPFFLGMLVGYILGMGLSYLVDTIWFIDNPHNFESFIR